MSLIAAEQSIVDRLATLRDLGLWVRTDPDKPAEQGIVQDNGSITVRHTGDQAGDFGDLSRQQQRITVTWLLDGRIRNLRSAGGLLVLRDSLYALLIGYKPAGMGPLALSSWNLAERAQNYWRFELELSCEQLFFGTEPADPSDVGANLAEVFFSPVEVRDRWGENVGTTTEFDAPVE